MQVSMCLMKRLGWGVVRGVAHGGQHVFLRGIWQPVVYVFGRKDARGLLVQTGKEGKEGKVV